MENQLTRLPALAVDCQTTGAAPDKGRLLIFSRAGILAADRIPAGSPVPPPPFWGPGRSLGPKALKGLLAMI